jgi:glycosyltransferase involved in cell wall biosynthesis
VSVICTVRNEARHLRAALAGALAGAVVEVLVVDDGSSDGSGALLTQLCAEDPRVRIVTAPAPGRGAALAAAFAAAGGEYVMNIDADDLVDPRWCRIGAAILDAHPQVAVVSAAPRYAGAGDVIEWDPVAPDIVAGDVTRRLPYYNPIAHSSSIMRRAAVDAVGGYDPQRRTHLDYDLWIRLAAAGWRIARADARLMCKRLHDGQQFEHRERRAYVRASAEMQARAIAALHAGLTARGVRWIRLAWGMMPRGIRMSARKWLARSTRGHRLHAAGVRLEPLHPPVRHP